MNSDKCGMKCIALCGRELPLTLSDLQDSGQVVGFCGLSGHLMTTEPY